MSDDTAEFRKKFKYVMNQMFPNTNQDFTFNNFDNYINDEKTKEIGLYVVKVKKGCTIELVSDLYKPEGPSEYKSKPLVELLNDNTMPKFQAKLSDSDDEYIYIGQTTRTIKKRLKEFKSFGITTGNTSIGHGGGKRIWFIKDNKNNLVIDYKTIDSLRDNFSQIYEKAEKLKKESKFSNFALTELIEAGLIFLHYFGYGYVYPFANEEDKKILKLKEAWKNFWEEEYQID